MFGSLMNSISYTYAHWDNHTEVKENMVTIGEWQFYTVWSNTITYQTGDVVLYNGQFWRAKKRSTGRTPSTNTPGSNFWALI